MRETMNRSLPSTVGSAQETQAEADSSHVPVVAVPDETRQKALDFQLDKTHANMREAQQALGHAFLAHLGFLGLAALLAFGAGFGIDDRVVTPVLQLTLNKYFVAIFALFASCGPLFWFWIGIWTVNQLKDKVEALYGERYGQREASFTHLDYPSLFLTILKMSKRTRQPDRAIVIVVVAILAADLLVPLVLAWHLTVVLRMAGWEQVVLYGTLFGAIAPAFVAAHLGTDEAVSELGGGRA